jgi:hypothetical protein
MDNLTADIAVLNGYAPSLPYPSWDLTIHKKYEYGAHHLRQDWRKAYCIPYVDMS